MYFKVLKRNTCLFLLRFEAQNVLEYFSCSFRENLTLFELITAPMVIFEIKTILDDQNRKKKTKTRHMNLTGRILLTLNADIHKFIHPPVSHYHCLLVFKCTEGFSVNCS